MEGAADGRQGDTDDRGIDASHGRPEHGSGDDPTASAGTVNEGGRRGYH